jgi:hypothetical protein
VSAVRADHDAGPFCDGRTALRTAADASDARTVPDEFLHRKPLSQLSAGLLGGLNQKLVEHCAPRRIALDDIARWRRRTGQGKVPEVKGECEQWRTVTSPELVQ